MGAGKREAEQMEKKQEKKQKTVIVFEVSKETDFGCSPTYYANKEDWDKVINDLNCEQSITITKHEVKDFKIVKNNDED